MTRKVDVLRQEVLADALGDVRVDLVLVEDAGLLVLLEHRAVGVDAPHLDLAGYCSLRYRPTPLIVPPVPTPTTRCVTRPVGLLPDLRTGLLVVRRRVREVVVLVGLPRVRHFLLEARRDRIVRARILRIDVGRADDHLGAERLQRVDLFLRLLVGRREDALVALHHRGDRQPHPGVAGRAFDDRAAGLEQPRPLGILDHPDGHAVLDRVAGIERLELGEHRRRHDALRDPVDAHHRRVTDGVEDGVGDLRHCPRVYIRPLHGRACAATGADSTHTHPQT